MAGSVKEKIGLPIPLNLNKASQIDLMDPPQVLYIMLLALGFNCERLEQKEKIQFSEHIFRKMNQRIGDHILHYLFSCINSKHASKVFRDCWPIYDKKLEAQFRNAAFEWFKILSQSEEYNLKPSLVVSKAVVMPTSNKFLSSVTTLCRIALHSKILQKDPSVHLIYFPCLALKKEQRQKAFNLITKSKLHHCSQYVSSVTDRANALKSLQLKAKELVDRYRAVVNEREQINANFHDRLEKSKFLSLTQKNRLRTASFHEFEKEIVERLKNKNEEMTRLWSNTSALRNEDKISWPKIESLIDGRKGFSTICGDDFAALSQIDVKNDFPFCEEHKMFYKEGKLDLVSMLQISNLALANLRSGSIDSCNKKAIDEETCEATDQLRCVTALKEDTNEVKLSIGSILPTLLESVSDLRREIYSRTDNDSSPNMDSFDLCPPTPAFNFENSNTSMSRLQTPYQLVKLTPSYNTTGNIGEDESLRDLTHVSDRVRNVSKDSLLQSLRNKRRAQQSECGSPILKNSFSRLPNTSSNHNTVDSGCILSYGTDSLLQSLEKLDLTPRNKRTRNSSYGLCKSVLGNSNRKTSLLVKKSKEPPRRYGSSLIGSPLVSDFKVENHNNSLNVSFKIENKENRRKSIIIETGNSFVLNKYGENNRVSENHCNEDMSELFLNLTLKNEDEDSFTEDCDEIKRKALELADSPKLHIQRSPLVSILLNEIENDDTSKRKFDSNTKEISEASLDVDRATTKEQGFNKLGKKLSTLREKSIQNITENYLTKSSDVGGRNVVETASKGGVGLMNVEKVEKNYSSHVTTSDVEKTFYSYMTSLESRLEGLDDNDSKYEFDSEFAFSKDLIDVSTGFSCGKEPSLGFEKFTDSRTYLEQCSNPSKWLPKQSAFDTLTEAFVSGELNSDLFFQDDEMEKEIRRESLSLSVRNSLSKKSRRSSGISPRLSEFLKRRVSVDTENIFDVSDSCLLSTSSDVI